jgi:hypothetical protein
MDALQSGQITGNPEVIAGSVSGNALLVSRDLLMRIQLISLVIVNLKTEQKTFSWLRGQWLCQLTIVARNDRLTSAIRWQVVEYKSITLPV